MAQTEIRLAREISLLQLTMIGADAMIGAGAFVLTGIKEGVAGGGVVSHQAPSSPLASRNRFPMEGSDGDD